MLSAAILGVLLLAAPTAKAKGNFLSEEQTLALINCIGVVGPAVNGPIAVNAEALKTQMELALRSAGIPVCPVLQPGERPTKENRFPGLLLLTVTAIQPKYGYAATWSLKVTH